MRNDGPAEDVLGEVLTEWRQGPLGELERLVAEVWRTNVDRRYEPELLGDDLMSLGVQSARNIMNRAVRELAGCPGVDARGGQTLEVRYAGRVLHVGKATSSSASDWDVWSVDWASSEIRDDAAWANSAAYQPDSGTLFEGRSDLLPLPGQGRDAARLRHLHLAWQGFLDGGHCRAWLGFPAARERPWHAVLPIFDTRADAPRAGLDGAAPPARRPAPSFDELEEAAVPIAVRRRRPSAPTGTSRP
jgi:hypothetical protein